MEEDMGTFMRMTFGLLTIAGVSWMVMIHYGVYDGKMLPAVLTTLGSVVVLMIAGEYPELAIRRGSQAVLIVMFSAITFTGDINPILGNTDYTAGILMLFLGVCVLSIDAVFDAV